MEWMLQVVDEIDDAISALRLLLGVDRRIRSGGGRQLRDRNSLSAGKPATRRSNAGKPTPL
jgi:hypothetical protein